MIALYYSMLFEYTNNIYLYNTYICVYMYKHTPSNIYANTYRVQFSSVNQLCPTLWTPWTAAHQASLSITNSRSLLKLMSITSVMPSNHLILCRPLLLLPSIFPSIRVFSNESALHIRWPKYWSFSFNISPSNEHPGLISFRMDWLNLLAVQGTLKSLLQHDSSSAAIVEPKSVTISIASSSNCHEVMGPDTMIFVFWMLSFKPVFSLSSFTFINRYFSQFAIYLSCCAFVHSSHTAFILVYWKCSSYFLTHGTQTHNLGLFLLLEFPLLFCKRWNFTHFQKMTQKTIVLLSSRKWVPFLPALPSATI